MKATSVRALPTASGARAETIFSISPTTRHGGGGLVAGEGFDGHGGGDRDRLRRGRRRAARVLRARGPPRRRRRGREARPPRHRGLRARGPAPPSPSWSCGTASPGAACACCGPTPAAASVSQPPTRSLCAESRSGGTTCSVVSCARFSKRARSSESFRTSRSKGPRSAEGIASGEPGPAPAPARGAAGSGRRRKRLRSAWNASISALLPGWSRRKTSAVSQPRRRASRSSQPTRRRPACRRPRSPRGSDPTARSACRGRRSPKA